MANTSDLAVLRQYFGLLPGTGLRDFREEVRALSADEQAELAALAREAMEESAAAA